MDWPQTKLSIAKNTEELEKVRDLLHLLFHRNKNQHRQSAWWRLFASYRREVARLLQDLSESGLSEQRASQRANENAQVISQSRLGKRISFWQDILVEKWYLAFSQLIATSQFSALGLVLLASLARVCYITGITTYYENLAQEDIQQLADEIATQSTSSILQRISTASDNEDFGEAVARSNPSKAKDDPFGESKPRNQDRQPNADKEPQQDTTGSQAEVKPSESTKKRKKKQRKMDAIDQLFSGL